LRRPLLCENRPSDPRNTSLPGLSPPRERDFFGDQHARVRPQSGLLWLPVHEGPDAPSIFRRPVVIFGESGSSAHCLRARFAWRQATSMNMGALGPSGLSSSFIRFHLRSPVPRPAILVDRQRTPPRAALDRLRGIGFHPTGQSPATRQLTPACKFNACFSGHRLHTVKGQRNRPPPSSPWLDPAACMT